MPLRPAESIIYFCLRAEAFPMSTTRPICWIRPRCKRFSTAAMFIRCRRPTCLPEALFARSSAMHKTLRRLRRAELPVDTVDLARYLIGKVVVHDSDDGRLSGRIVETEAYPVGDSAGHAFRGETRRNATLFLGRGYAYVYFTYGSSFMLNVTSEKAGVGAGVLLRALEPLEGLDRMERLRGGAGLLDLARGPGRLAEAMQIDFRQDGLDLCAAGELWLASGGRKTGAIGSSVRIGLTRNVDLKLRFYERGSLYVSGPKRLRE